MFNEIPGDGNHLIANTETGGSEAELIESHERTNHKQGKAQILIPLAANNLLVAGQVHDLQFRNNLSILNGNLLLSAPMRRNSIAPDADCETQAGFAHQKALACALCAAMFMRKTNPAGCTAPAGVFRDARA